jgi:hypothetical protein
MVVRPAVFAFPINFLSIPMERFANDAKLLPLFNKLEGSFPCRTVTALDDRRLEGLSGTVTVQVNY